MFKTNYVGLPQVLDHAVHPLIDFPQSELDFWILDCFGFGLGGLDLGLGLDNKKIHKTKKSNKVVVVRSSETYIKIG